MYLTEELEKEDKAQTRDEKRGGRLNRENRLRLDEEGEVRWGRDRPAVLQACGLVGWPGVGSRLSGPETNNRDYRRGCGSQHLTAFYKTTRKAAGLP